MNVLSDASFQYNTLIFSVVNDAELYGEFEDLETGETYTGNTNEDKEENEKQETEERKEKKRKLKTQFDAEYTNNAICLSVY